MQEKLSPPPEQVASIAHHVLDDFLGIHLAPAGNSEAETEQGVASRIFITGAWDGSVSLFCSDRLSRRIASGMFGVPSGNVSIDDVQDALGELVNILGGNIKSLFPSPSQLSLPFHGGDPEPGRPLCEIHLRSEDGQVFRLLIMQYEGKDSA